jgi:uncharacterized membrane protein YeiB
MSMKNSNDTSANRSCDLHVCSAVPPPLRTRVPQTEITTRNISWGIKTAGPSGSQPCNLHVPIVLKSGGLNILEPSGPVLACNGIALSLGCIEKWQLKFNFMSFSDVGLILLSNFPLHSIRPSFSFSLCSVFFPQITVFIFILLITFRD